MHFEFIQNQEDLFARILDQGLQAFNEFFGIKRLFNGHPARLALIGDCGDHRELLTRAAHSHGHRSFTHRRAAPAPHVGVDQFCFIAPVKPLWLTQINRRWRAFRVASSSPRFFMEPGLTVSLTLAAVATKRRAAFRPSCVFRFRAVLFLWQLKVEKNPAPRPCRQRVLAPVTGSTL